MIMLQLFHDLYGLITSIINPVIQYFGYLYRRPVRKMVDIELVLKYQNYPSIIRISLRIWDAGNIDFSPV